MKKSLIFIIFLIFVSPCVAWRWETHEAIVEQAYKNWPLQPQSKMNLTLLKIGSTVPDKIFKDNYQHHYPASLPLIEGWLELAKQQYHEGQYDNSSYSFGIATHYLTDSFAAPHCTSDDSYNMHLEFEKQAADNTLHANCWGEGADLRQMLEEAYTKGGEDWELWRKTKSQRISKKEINEATKAVMLVSSQTFVFDCAKISYTALKWAIMAIVFVAATFLIIKFYKKR